MRLTATTTRFKTMLLIITALLMISAMAAIVVLDARDRILSLRGAEAKNALQIALSELERHVDLVEAGEMTSEAAQANALTALSRITFDHGLGYVAVQTDDYVNILHPNPDVSGKDLTFLQDSDGRFIAREVVQIGLRGGIGWNTYKFVHPTTGEEDVKTSAIARFKPWKWTLVVGVYDRELKALVAEMIQSAIASGFVMISIFSVIAFFLARTMTAPLHQVSMATARVADGQLATDIPYRDLPNEVGRIANAVEGFRQNALEITDLNLRLENALEREREFTGQQRRFVSMVSHEFRTPVAIIQGNCHSLKRKLDKLEPEAVLNKIARISRAGDRMIQLLETVLYTSKTEEGSIQYKFEDFDLAELLSDIVEEMNEVHEKHRIAFDPSGLPSVFHGDENMLRQVFINLISNAVKFSPAAEQVDIVTRVTEQEIEIDVTDYGIGIPKDEIDKLFTRFFRASTATGIPGTGIGLNLVGTLVAAHGGQVGLQSDVGEGSTFSVRLPRKQVVTAGGTEAAVA
ncbi:MAG: ATP-binding protein [Pseudomonadota bacterium]